MQSARALAGTINLSCRGLSNYRPRNNAWWMISPRTRRLFHRDQIRCARKRHPLLRVSARDRVVRFPMRTRTRLPPPSRAIRYRADGAMRWARKALTGRIRTASSTHSPNTKPPSHRFPSAPAKRERRSPAHAPRRSAEPCSFAHSVAPRLRAALPETTSTAAGECDRQLQHRPAGARARFPSVR